MGLDMFLTRKKYVGAEYSHRNVKGTIYILIGDKQLPVDFDRVSYIEESVGYWRKANAIHNWFVENVQDGIDNCNDYYVSTGQLQELLDLCKKVKKIAKVKDGEHEEDRIIENVEEIEELLPTCEGCFFGTTNYDGWYMQDIDYTIDLLKKLLKEEKELNEIGFYSDFYYRSSW